MNMTTLAIPSAATALVRPEPRSPISIRAAMANDLVFMDALQKKHSKMVGFFPRTWFEKRIAAGQVLIALDDTPGGSYERIGYCIFTDKYLKREELGIFYQVNVLPSRHRGLIGAALVKAALDRAAYGCKLACCWCAQDLEANHFWESLGFVPLAFRAGSRGKAHGGTRKNTRLQVFWQRRVREGDDCPYWFPSYTDGGLMKEGRIVLPIPPGTHWSEAMPMVLPGAPVDVAGALPEGEPKPKAKRERPPKAKPAAPPPKLPLSVTNGLRFGPLPTVVEPKAPKVKPKREKQRNDPRHVAAAREVRDRCLEEINAGRMLPGGGANGKYDVSRQLAATASDLKHAPLLDAA